MLRFHVASAGFRSIGAPGFLIPRRAALSVPKKFCIAYQRDRRVRASVGKLNLKVWRRATVSIVNKQSVVSLCDGVSSLRK